MSVNLSMKYADGYVDVRYGSKFVETLFEKNWLIPGVTYTNEYQLDRGGMYVFHKQDGSDTNDPETVGADYDKKNYKNINITLSLLNQYSETLKIPNATIAATSASVIENTYRNQAMQIATRQMRSAIACLLTEGMGVASAGGSAVDEKNIVSRIESAAADGTLEFGAVDTVLLRPHLFNMLRGVLPKTQITPAFNEELIRAGINVHSFNWNGINFFSVAGLANKENLSYSYKTMDGNTETNKTVAASAISNTNFIAYNHRAFAKVDLLSTVKAFDSHDAPIMQITSCVTNGFGAIYGNHIIVDKATA